MKQDPIRSISVILPVYNEEESLPPLYQELVAMANLLQNFQVEFIFVDDGSKDSSVDIIRELGQKDSRVKGVFFKRNFGQTAAMSCGIKSASGDIIIPMDADLQNDPADIPKFLEKINEGYSCVSGWRKNRQDDLLLRKFPSWIANFIISIVSGVSLHDYGCSLKAYRRDIIQDVELYGEMHRFIPAYAVWSGAKVTEMVVNHRARRFGMSKYGLSRVFKVMLDLIVVKFLTNYFNKPMHFFGAVGFISLILGILAEMSAIILRFYGIYLIQTPLPTVGALFIIVGVQLILFGLMAEVMMRVYYESKGRSSYSIRETVNL
jgi:dolichol-phosphate mannosyltransferase